MAREVLLRKLAYLRHLLSDLAPFLDASLQQVSAEHYKVERILELMVATASDILFHLLAERNVAPDSYRDAFRLAADEGLLPYELAERLQEAAGMRNVLVHLYERIDFAILHDTIEPALHDFGEFAALFDSRLDDESTNLDQR